MPYPIPSPDACCNLRGRGRERIEAELRSPALPKGGALRMALDPVLVALSTLGDDRSPQPGAGAKPVRPGPRPPVAASEGLTVALCGQWGGRSARAFFALCAAGVAGVLPAAAEPEGVEPAGAGRGGGGGGLGAGGGAGGAGGGGSL